MFKDTVGNVSSLPVEIQDFYFEEIVSELTGEQVEEIYTYLDGDGIEQTGTRLVYEYQDVTYIRINQRVQSTSFEKVEQVINKHNGERDDVVDIFANFYIETLKWNYHDSYIEWLEKRPDTTDEKYDLNDEETSEPLYSFDNDLSEWESLEPVLPTFPTLEEWKLHNYSILRKAAYLPMEKQLEMQFDGTWNDHILEVKAKYPKE